VSVATLPGNGTYLERIQSHVLDLNLDGKLDFFIPSTQSVTTPKTQVIAVLSGNGTGNLSTAQRQPATGSLQYVMSIPLTVGAPASALFAAMAVDLGHAYLVGQQEQDAADAHAIYLIADHDKRREREPPATLDHLGHAVDRDDPLFVLALGHDNLPCSL